MVLALEIRKDRTPAVLRRLAKEADDVRIARRILAIANALDGMSRDEAARAAGMDRQTLRDWVLRYNAHGVDGLADRWNGGRRPMFTPEEQAAIVEIVLAGPDIETSGLSAYTLEDLAKVCEERFGKRMHPWSLGRLLKNSACRGRRRGLFTLKQTQSLRRLLKNVPRILRSIRKRTKKRVRIFFQDEARIGQKAEPAMCGGSAASVLAASPTNASRSPTSSPPWSPEPTTPSR